MDKVTKVKNRVRAIQWANIIRECQESEQTVVSWCEQNNVGIKAYYYWLRKLREQTLDDTATPELLMESPPKPVTFKKLEVASPIPNAQAAVIIRFHNATVEVQEGTSQQTVQAVLLALQSIC